MIVNIKSSQKYDVYCGRSGNGKDGYFGNQFVIGKDGDRNEVCDKFEIYFQDRVKNDIEFRNRVYGLRGKVLGCFCVPNRCHCETYVNWLNKPSKIIICGSRTITDRVLIEKAIEESGFIIDECVCGLAKGVDSVSRLICLQTGVVVVEFPAHWDDFTEIPCKIKIDKNGRKFNCLAGINRNKRMIDYIMPDGKVIAVHNFSSGTLSTIKLARDRGLEVFEKVVNV